LIQLTASDKKYKLLKNELLRHLYVHKVLTLNELSACTGKSVPLITSAINDLITEEYVIEHGLAASTGGRRAQGFLLNQKKRRFIVSVALDQMVAQIAIYDMLNGPQKPVEVMSLKLAEDKEAIKKLVPFITKHIEKSGIPKDQLLGVGIGMPGFIDAHNGINHSFFKLPGETNLRTYLEKEIGLPVFIDNDSSLIALAELKFGQGKGEKEVMVVNIGWGIGLGMIINGKLFRGHSGLAGEFSHIPLSQSNKLCSCGKRGCLEVDTSLLVQVERARVEMASGVDSSMERLFEDNSRLPGEHLLDAANAGDPLAVKILSDAAFLIGKGLSTLIHIMNPKLIILSGRGAAASKIILAPIHQAINEFCIPRIAEYTEIKASKIASESELLGAAILVMDNCDFN
jgi:predicted NBD/HSP70 family sugar kinase